MIQNSKDIRLLDLPEMVKVFEDMGEKKFRAKQIYEWLWKKGVTDFDSMTNLSKELREKLKRNYIFRPIKTDTIQKSSDGTIKSRFRLFDGSLIESVLIPVEKDDRYTLCVSSQAGCSLSCKFCATGKMKRVRNLDPGEIYDQFVIVNKQSLAYFGKPITNIVYMGMGEPLLSYKSVTKSIDHLCSNYGVGMSSRRITISTAGISKMIKKLADDHSKVNLALSLHAADDEKRNKIMPINEKNNIDGLMEALHYYYRKTRNRISYEYICFRGFNDTLEDAEKLFGLCKRFPVRVNIIEYNPISGTDFIKSDEDQINRFAAHLRNKGVMITLRRSRGKDIDAACGQLANIEDNT